MIDRRLGFSISQKLPTKLREANKGRSGGKKCMLQYTELKMKFSSLGY